MPLRGVRNLWVAGFESIQMKLHETSRVQRAFRAGPDLGPEETIFLERRLNRAVRYEPRRQNGSSQHLISILIISILVNSAADREGLMTDNNDKPGHLARRFQQI